MFKGHGFVLVIVLPLILFVSLALPGLISCEKPAPTSDSTAAPAPSLPTEQLIVAGQNFTVELAYKRTTRARGLMFRKELPPDAGMLFIFAEAQPRSFYMMNCLIDLDLIFIEPTGRIAKITTMKAPLPGRPLIYYDCFSPVKYALELPAGTAGKLKLRPGARIELPAWLGRITPDPD